MEHRSLRVGAAQFGSTGRLHIHSGENELCCRFRRRSSHYQEPLSLGPSGQDQPEEEKGGEKRCFSGILGLELMMGGSWVRNFTKL